MAASLAKELHAITEHDVGQERFDLAGWEKSQIVDLVAAAFKDHTWPCALRFSFVVGGGRLVRQRYNEDLPKWLSQSLTEIGFEVRAWRAAREQLLASARARVRRACCGCTHPLVHAARHVRRTMQLCS